MSEQSAVRFMLLWSQKVITYPAHVWQLWVVSPTFIRSTLTSIAFQTRGALWAGGEWMTTYANWKIWREKIIGNIYH